jgi:hypothetical protein
MFKGTVLLNLSYILPAFVFFPPRLANLAVTEALCLNPDDSSSRSGAHTQSVPSFIYRGQGGFSLAVMKIKIFVSHAQPPFCPVCFLFVWNPGLPCRRCANETFPREARAPQNALEDTNSGITIFKNSSSHLTLITRISASFYSIKIWNSLIVRSELGQQLWDSVQCFQPYIFLKIHDPADKMISLNATMIVSCLIKTPR